MAVHRPFTMSEPTKCEFCGTENRGCGTILQLNPLGHVPCPPRLVQSYRCRILELEGELAKVTADLEASKNSLKVANARANKAEHRAELLDFMLHFGVEPKAKPGSRNGLRVIVYTVSTINMAISQFAHDHGDWDTPEQALADCRDLAVKEWGWANRPKKGIA